MIKGNKRAVFLLRAGIGIYLLSLGFCKIMDPLSSQAFLSSISPVGISANVVYGFGVVQLFFALFFLSGFHRHWTYPVAVLIQAIVLFGSVGDVASVINAVPVLFACMSLYLLQKDDVYMSLAN
jgi:hypothetical protein